MWRTVNGNDDDGTVNVGVCGTSGAECAIVVECMKGSKIYDSAKANKTAQLRGEEGRRN